MKNVVKIFCNPFYTGIITSHSLGVSPRGNRGIRPALANGFIASLLVVGTIHGDLTDLPGNLRQQRRKHSTIMNVACGNLHGCNLFGVLINFQMEFAPPMALISAMFLDVPLPGSVYPKTGGINDNVTGPAI